MGDLEQECEEALFVLCDARQRYPQKCANELERRIRLTSEICMTPCVTKNAVDSSCTVTPFTDEQNKFLDIGLGNRNVSLELLDRKVEKMMEKMDNLRAVMEQVKKDKTDTRFTYE